MTIATEENFHEVFSNRDRQRALVRKRRAGFHSRSVKLKEFSGEPADGWEVDKELKHSVRLKKAKQTDELFEDQLWLIFSAMGFKFLNTDRNCEIQYGKDPAEKKQIDVIAVDDEVAVVVECKSSNKEEPQKGVFKTDIEALAERREGTIRRIRKLFAKPKMKVAFVFATQNYQVTEADKSRLSEKSIRHFSEADAEYYSELVKHLGSAARFQLEADLFPNQAIPEIDGRVHAVKSRMGGVNYLSFCIEPEKLLKLGYVLHRSRSIKLMPTYQRLIKRHRLNAIRKFIRDGGYFPNSLIINIETGRKGVRFEASEQKLEDTATQGGIAHLPTKYRSAYIIDGQHRLYGYADSGNESRDAIPVVAFENLERSRQLRIFMEINENQKAVSTNLRNTLGADMNYDSPNLNERADGLIKTVAQSIGEDVSSPLYGRVLIGEDQKTDYKVITLDAIVRGLKTTNFVGDFTKDTVKKPGVFYFGSNDKSLPEITAFLVGVFEAVQSSAPEEWARRQKDGGVILTSDGTRAIIQLSGDLVDHAVRQGKLDPSGNSAEEALQVVSPMLIRLGEFFETLSEDVRLDLRTRAGSKAPVRIWRTLQKYISDDYPEFKPEGLEEYWRDQSRQFNRDALDQIQEIEAYFNRDVRERLENEYGPKWLKNGVQLKVYKEITALASEKNYDIDDPTEEYEPWDCLYFRHYREIILKSPEWSTIFQKAYTVPGQEKGNKERRTDWIVRLNDIRNDLSHNRSVSEQNAKFVDAVYKWLLDEDDSAIRILNAEELETT